MEQLKAPSNASKRVILPQTTSFVLMGAIVNQKSRKMFPRLLFPTYPVDSQTVISVTRDVTPRRRLPSRRSAALHMSFCFLVFSS